MCALTAYISAFHTSKTEIYTHFWRDIQGRHVINSDAPTLPNLKRFCYVQKGNIDINEREGPQENNL